MIYQNFRISLSGWFQSSSRLAVAEKQFDFTMHTGVPLQPTSIFLVEVQFPSVILALEGRGVFIPGQKPVSLKKLTLTTKAACSQGGDVWAPQIPSVNVCSPSLLTSLLSLSSSCVVTTLALSSSAFKALKLSWYTGALRA